MGRPRGPASWSPVDPSRRQLPHPDDWNEDDQRVAQKHGWGLHVEGTKRGGTAGLGYVVEPYGYNNVLAPKNPQHRAWGRVLYAIAWGDRALEGTAVRALRVIIPEEFTQLLHYAESIWAKDWKPENRVALVNRLRTIRKVEK